MTTVPPPAETPILLIEWLRDKENEMWLAVGAGVLFALMLVTVSVSGGLFGKEN